MSLMLKVATFSGSLYPTFEVPALNGLYVLETSFLELPRDALPLTARYYGDFGGTARSFQYQLTRTLIDGQ